MRAFGIPLISTIHHPLSIDRRTWFEQPSSLKQKIKMILYYPLCMQSFVARRMDTIVTVSKNSALHIERDFGVPAHRIRVVYNGVDAELFRPLPDEPKVHKRIIFVGNVADRKKGVLFLLQAMNFLPKDVQLVIVDGGTPARVSTWQLIEHFQLQGRVHVTGKVEVHDLVKLYSSAQLAVVPSLYEGFGFPAAEAMACGLPVVATWAGALPEVVGEDGRAGILVEPRNPRALAKGILDLVENAELCQKMGREGRRRILSLFTWKRAAQQLVDVYREALDAHRGLQEVLSKRG
jgi:glycosyltransferase involved in cell wall biosynthesis